MLFARFIVNTRRITAATGNLVSHEKRNSNNNNGNSPFWRSLLNYINFPEIIYVVVSVSFRSCIREIFSELHYCLPKKYDTLLEIVIVYTDT